MINKIDRGISNTTSIVPVISISGSVMSIALKLIKRSSSLVPSIITMNRGRIFVNANNENLPLGAICALKGRSINAPRHDRRVFGIENYWTKVQGIKPIIFNNIRQPAYIQKMPLG